MSLSNVIDSKVVELSFENRNFETNARTSLSTIEKLKKALDFSTTKNGFDYIDEGARKVNINPLTQSVGALKIALADLGKIAVFSMIADEAIKAKNAVANFVKSVTLDQVTAGLDRYAEKTEAVQTIMAATAKEIEDTEERMGYVNEQLEKLNWFSDETSYSFTDMVSNIGKFTSTGMELNKSVTAMQGISTWAAISGQNTQEASRAMYNLSQALSTGAVKLMDWKSIENANMATAEFKETAMQTAESLHILTKAADGTYKTVDGTEVSIQSFNQTLQKGWFTSEVLMDTLDKYGAFATAVSDTMTEMWDTGHDLTTSEFLEYIDAFSEGAMTEQEMAKAAQETGYSVDELREKLTALSSEEYDLGRKAFKAAQEAKTFTEAVDSVKDAASTGWMNTFELMFGDYLEAKELWTTLANDLYEIFAEGGNARNELIEQAFESSGKINEADWKKIEESGLASPAYMKAIIAAGQAHGRISKDITADEANFTSLVKEGAIAVSDLEEAWNSLDLGKSAGEKAIANVEQIREEALNVIRGKYLNDWEKERHQLMLDAGLDEQTIALTRTYVDVLSKLTGGAWDNINEEILAQAEASEEFTAALAELSDAELREMGVTDKAIEEWNKSGKTIEDLYSIIGSRPTGGELWTDTVYKSLDILMNIVSRVRSAMSTVFPKTTVDMAYDFIVMLNNGVSAVERFTATNKNLGRILRAVFSIVKIVGEVIGTVFFNAVGIFSPVISALFNLLGYFSKYINVLRDVVDSTGILTKVINFVLAPFHLLGEFVNTLVNQFIEFATASKFVTKFRALITGNFNKIGREINFISGVFEKFVGHVRSLKTINLGTIQNAFNSLAAAFMVLEARYGVVKKIKKAFGDLKNSILSLKLPFSKSEKTVGDMFDSLDKLFGITNKFTNFKKQLEHFAESAQEKFGVLRDRLLAFDGFSFDNLGQSIELIWSTIRGTIGDLPFIDAISNRFTKIKETIGEKFNYAFSKARLSVDNFLKTLKGYDILKKIRSAFQDLPKKILGSKFIENVSEKFEALKSKWDDLKDFDWGELINDIREFGQTILDNLAETPVGKFATKLKTQTEIMVANTKTRFGYLWDRISAMDGITFDNVIAAIQDFGSTLMWTLKEVPIIGPVFAFLEDAFNSIGSVTGPLIDSATNSVRGFIDTLLNLPIVRSVVDFFGKTIEKVFGGNLSLDKFWESLNGIFESLQSLGGNIWTDITSNLSNFNGFESIKSAFVAVWEDIGEWAGNIEFPFLDTIKNKFVLFIENTKTRFKYLWKNISKLDGFSIENAKKALNMFGNTLAAELMSIPGVKELIEVFGELRDKILSLFKKDADTDEAKEGAEKSKSALQIVIDAVKSILKRVAGINAGDLILIGSLIAIMVSLQNVFKIAKILKADPAADAKKAEFQFGYLTTILSALVMLSRMPFENVLKTAGVMVGVFIALTLVFAAMTKISSRASNVEETGAAVKAIAESIAILVGIMKLMDTLKPKYVIRNLVVLGVLFTMIGLLMRSMNKNTAWYDPKGAGGGMLGAASSILILVTVVKQLDKLQVEHPIKVLVMLNILIHYVKKLLKGLKGVGEASLGTAATIGAVSVLLLAMTGVVAIISKLAPSVGNAIVTSFLLGKMAAAIKGMVKAIGKAEPGAGTTTSLLALSALLAVLSLCMLAISKVPAESALKAMFVIKSTVKSLAKVIKDLKKTFSGSIKSNLASVGLGLLAMAAVAGIIVLLFSAFNKIKAEDANKILELSASMMLVTNSITRMISALSALPGGWAGGAMAAVNLIEFVGIISAVAMAIGAIKWLLEDKLGVDTTWLVNAVDTGFDVIEHIFERLGGLVRSLLKGLLGMDIKLPSGKDLEKSLMGILDTTKTVGEKVKEIGEIDVDFDGVVKLAKSLGIGAIAGLGVQFADFLGKNLFDSDESTIDTFCNGVGQMARALGEWEAQGLSEFTPVPIDHIIALSLSVGVTAYAGLGIQMADFISNNLFDSDEGTIETFTTGIGRMAKALRAWEDEHISEITPIDFAAVWDLAKSVGACAGAGLMLQAIQFISENVFEMDEDTITTFRKGVHRMARALSVWKEEGVSKLKVPSDGINDLARSVVIVSGAGLATKVADLIGGFISQDDNFSAVDQFKHDVEVMADALKLWASKHVGSIKVPVAGIDRLSDALTTVSFAGLGAGVNDMIGSIIGQHTNGNSNFSSLEQFKHDLEIMAEALEAWTSKNIGEIEIDTAGISRLEGAVSQMNFEGLLGAIANAVAPIHKENESGDKKTISEMFVEDVGNLATALETFAKTVEGLMDPSELLDASKTLETLNNTAKELPETGGLLDYLSTIFVGETDYEEFKENCQKLGDALYYFECGINGKDPATGKALGDGLHDIDTTSISRLAVAAKSISEILQAAYNIAANDNFADMGTWTQASQTVTQFYKDLGTSMREMMDNFGAGKEGKVRIGDFERVVDAIDIMARAARLLSTMNMTTGDINNDEKVDSFTERIGKLREKIESLVGIDTSGVDSMDEAIKKLNEMQLAGSAESYQEASVNNAQTGADSAGELASGFNGELSNQAGAASTAGSDLATGAVQGIRGKADTFKAAGTYLALTFSKALSAYDPSSYSGTLAQNAVNAINGYYEKFKGVGLFVAGGFANGMSEDKSVVAAAKRLAERALEEMRRVTAEASPSKEAFKIGHFVVLGFANALNAGDRMADEAGENLAGSAISAMDRGMRQAKDYINDAFTTQPVIRPVLDLADVEAGAANMNRIVRLDQPIGVTEMLGSISESVNYRNSRSTLDDLVYAMSALQPTEGPRNTYVVNGVTYDDGSNIATSVKDLIRYANVERRSN